MPDLSGAPDQYCYERGIATATIVKCFIAFVIKHVTIEITSWYLNRASVYDIALWAQPMTASITILSWTDRVYVWRSTTFLRVYSIADDEIRSTDMLKGPICAMVWEGRDAVKSKPVELCVSHRCIFGKHDVLIDR